MSSPSPDFLSADYAAALGRLHRIEDRLLASGAGGLLVTVATAAYTLGHRTDINPGYAWATPLPFLALGAVLLALWGWRVIARNQVNALRRQAGLADLPGAHAGPFLHRLLVLPIFGLGGLYVLTLLFALRNIYTASRVAGTSFGLIYALLSAALAVAGWAVWRLWRGQRPLTAGEVRRLLLPYPDDLLAGFGLAGLGFLIASLTAGLNISQLEVLNALFRRALDFTSEVPLAAILALGLAYLLVVEGLLVPAGRMWRERRAGVEAPFGYAQIAARGLLGLALAYLLGGVTLLVVALLICLQQAIAGLVLPLPANGSPRANSRARFDLLWGGLLAPLRFYAGALVWLGLAWRFSLLLFLFCALAFLAVGLRAGQRARQARVRQVENLPASAYDLHSAPRWQRAGFLAAGLTLVMLVVFQVLAEDCAFSGIYLESIYGRCKNGVTIYRQLNPLNSVLLVVDLALAGLFAANLVVRLLEKAGDTFVWVALRTRTAGIPLLLVVALALAIAALAASLPSLALGGLLSLAVGITLWAER
jgi:hypothetical protein